MLRCYPLRGKSLLKTRQTNDYELLSCLSWGSQERLVEGVQTLSHVGLGSRPDTLSVCLSFLICKMRITTYHRKLL